MACEGGPSQALGRRALRSVFGHESPLPHHTQPDCLRSDKGPSLLPAFTLIASRREEHRTPAGGTLRPQAWEPQSFSSLARLPPRIISFWASGISAFRMLSIASGQL